MTVSLAISSCSREDILSPVSFGQETYAVFNISVASNTKTKSKIRLMSITKSQDDSKTSYDTEKTYANFDSNTAFGLVGIDKVSFNVLVENEPVYERNGVRSVNYVTSGNAASMIATAFYPYVSNVSHYKNGSYAISFTPNDICKGPLASNAVEMRCGQVFETVNLNFHHISNSIGFKVCDITDDEQLRGYMHVRKVVLHGMPTEGSYVVNGMDSHWVPNAKREEIVFFEGDALVEYGEENADYVGNDRLSDRKEDCNRFYVVPEELKSGKHYVELFFDVDDFDYDGTHYSGSRNRSQIIPLSGVIPDDIFEMGLQYTFTLGMNLCTVYRPIEFTANVEDWEILYNGRILDYDNE